MIGGGGIIRYRSIGFTVVALSLLTYLGGCGVQTTTAAPGPSSIKMFSTSARSIGPTPKQWPTDHENVSNNANTTASVSASKGPHYIVRFPYKISSDSPVVNNILYMTSGNVSGQSQPASGTIWAVNPSNGHVLWKHTLPNSVFAEPIVTDGRVYVGVGNITFPHGADAPHTIRGTKTSGVWVFSAKSGAPLWHYETPGSDQPPVSISHGVAYLASGSRNLYALNAATGHLLWTVPLNSYVSRSGPRIVGNRLFVGGADTYSVDAFDLNTHKRVWRHTFKDVQAGMDDTPVGYASGTVLTAGISVTHDASIPRTSSHFHAMLYALNAASGKLRWRTELATGVKPVLKATGTPVVHQGVVYAGNAINGRFVAVSLHTGHILWSFNAQEPVKKPPTIENNQVIFVNSAGTVFRLSMSGKLLGKASVGKAENARGPIIINNTILTVINTGTYGYLWALPLQNLSKS